MNRPIISVEQIQTAIQYHGHSCPGLAIGIRAIEMAAVEFGKIPDTAFSVSSETDKCPSDAIRFFTGCTMENGNLSLNDHGENIFSFFRQSDGKGKKINLKSDLFKGGDDRIMMLRKKMANEKLTTEEDQLLKDLMAIQVKQVMDADLESLFSVEEIDRKFTIKA